MGVQAATEPIFLGAEVGAGGLSRASTAGAGAAAARRGFPGEQPRLGALLTKHAEWESDEYRLGVEIQSLINSARQVKARDVDANAAARLSGKGPTNTTKHLDAHKTLIRSTEADLDGAREAKVQTRPPSSPRWLLTRSAGTCGQPSGWRPGTSRQPSTWTGRPTT